MSESLTLASKSPVTGAVLGTVPVRTDEEVAAAVRAAREAAMGWAETPPRARAKALGRLRRRLMAREATLVERIVAETGKPRIEAYGAEVFFTAYMLRYYERAAPKLLAPRRVRTRLTAHKRFYVEREPLGVVGVISAWNYPFWLPMSAVVPAVAAGNAVVLKPSELTPLVGLEIERLFAEAGFPDRVVQVITGGPATGRALLGAGPDKLAFVGSAATGRRVHAEAAVRMIPTVMELGGKDVAVVLADARLDRAARAVVWGAFANSGQTCASVERVYVERAVAEAFVDRVLEETSRLRQGPDTDGQVDVGAMASERQMAVVEAHVADAVRKGARVLLGGKRAALPGLFFEPTVLVHVNHTMRLMHEETFGPVLPIQVVEDAEEALALANDSEYGLTASLFTRNERRARALARRLRVGTVVVNDTFGGASSPEVPWGGVKSSGLGRTLGPEGLAEFTTSKTVSVDRLQLGRDVQWYPYGPATLRWMRRVGRALFAR